jgi:hypothetical protein
LVAATTDVDRMGRVSRPQDFTLLQKPEQLPVDVEREVADFVQNSVPPDCGPQHAR